MKHLSLGKKFSVIVTLLSVAIVAITFIGLSAVKEENTLMDNITEDHVTSLKHTKVLVANMNDLGDGEKSFLLNSITKNVENAADDLKGIEEIQKTIAASLEILKKNADQDEVKHIADFEALFAEWKSFHQKLVELTNAHKHDEAIRLEMQDSEAVQSKMDSVLANLAKVSEDSIAKASAEADQLYAASMRHTLVIALIFLFLGISISVMVIRSTVRSIDDVVSRLNTSVGVVGESSAEIAASSTQLSASVSEQAGALQETAASVEELSSMVDRNTESAKTADQLSSKSQRTAQNGVEVVQRMMTSMSRIAESNDEIMNEVTHSNQQMNEILKVIDEVNSKTRVINDIVFQTKLLSFNASVEAARAGEHGKGFAVVAEEVGNLAQMSGNASKEIATLLEQSTARVNQIVSESQNKVSRVVESGKNEVHQGAQIAKQCEASLQEIMSNVSQVTETAGEISKAGIEQSKGLQEIKQAMNQLDTVTHQNASAAEQSSTSAARLSQEAEGLKGVVSDLLQSVYGKNNHQKNLVQTNNPEIHNHRKAA
jgi:methyl-accepting chemotaxis protein